MVTASVGSASPAVGGSPIVSRTHVGLGMSRMDVKRCALQGEVGRVTEYSIPIH